MSNKAKKRTLDILGAVISFALPAAAAVAEFPRVKASTGGAGSLAALLNLSTAALAVIAILAAITAYRFFRDRIKMPKSGFVLSLVLYAVVHGINVIVDSMEVILFWSVIGCAIAGVLYFIADKKYGGHDE